MIIVEIDNKNYEVRNLGSEVTLNELARISAILDNGSEDEGVDFADKWLRVIEIVSSSDFVDVMHIEHMEQIIKDFAVVGIKNKIQPTFEVNNRVYTLAMDGEEMRVSGRDMVAIEAMARKGGAWATKAIALLYKDEQLTPKEHYTPAHIKHKADLFGNAMTAEIAAPVIFQLSKKIVQYIDRLIDAQNKSVQGVSASE